MNFGFNSNVRCGDALYHVQTEDRGPTHPFLDTVVYRSGRVVYKRSSSYEKFARETDAKLLPQKLHDRLSQQHRDVIADLEAGKLELHRQEKRAVEATEPSETAPESRAAIVDDKHELDLRLRNPQSWLKAGNISLEIELFEKGSKRRISDADVQACLERDKRRIPCAEQRTDEKGCVTLHFPVPPDVSEGSLLVVRASDGTRYGELRFRLKPKTREKSPAPVAR